MNEKQHTILVVDDDALLRMHVSDVLIDAGYRVLEAFDTDMALKIILEQRGEITLLFTDVQMPPGADGLELSAAVRRAGHMCCCLSHLATSICPTTTFQTAASLSRSLIRTGRSWATTRLMEEAPQHPEA